MPHIFNDILVVTLEELVPEFYTSEKSVSNACKRGEKRGYGMRRVQLGGNGRQMLIDFDSLPIDIRQAIGDPRKVGHILEKFFKTDRETVDFYRDYTFEDGSHIDEKIQDKYIANACLLKACQRLKVAREAEIIGKGYKPKAILTTLWKDALSFKPIMARKFEMVSTLPEAEPRFRETYKRFDELRYISLISKKHLNKNAAPDNQEEIMKLLNDMFGTQKQKPNYTEVARQYESFLSGYLDVINNATGELYTPDGFQKLSKTTIYNYLNTYENSIGTLAARSGNRQVLIGDTIPYHSLLHPEFAGSIISIDDRQPPFEYAKGKRMWFYNGIDLGSEAFTCWVYGKTKEGIILDFYRQMVRNYAEWGFKLPYEIECESSLNSSFADSFLREGYMFEAVRIEANNARGKRIEAYYRPLRYGIEKKHAGWLARPFALSESNQAGSDKVEMVPYDKLINQCLGDIETWNNMPHSIYKDKTRWEVFTEKQHPNLLPTNYRGFLRNLGYRTTTSCRAGIINFQKAEWILGDQGEIYTGSRLINLMKMVEGENIDIYWIDANDGSILKALVYIGDTLICEALPKPRYHRAKLEQTEADFEAREIMSKYATTIEAYQRLRKNELEPVTIIDNTPRTLNNKFKMPGLHRNVEPEIVEVEILPEPDPEDDFNSVSTSFKTSLKDRF